MSTANIYARVTNNMICTDSFDGFSYIDRSDISNCANVDFEGVNRLVIDRSNNGTMTIIQTSGWTRTRGIFCDMYSPKTGRFIYQFK